ncbi:phosphoheptose isomerase [Clostridium sp. CAG:253]|jgi:D-sedoheptulose 7-phosphate isomerase|nr:phosphoheptose isomerase [Clostridium sp. CAG:253]
MLSEEMNKHIKLLTKRYPMLCCCQEAIAKAFEIMENVYAAGGKMLIAGNGGSAADSEHIVGELMKSFKLPRKVSDVFIEKLKSVDKERAEKLANELQNGLPAIALDGHIALTTAHLNDVDGVTGFAQQLYGYAKKNDAFMGISTSGNSKNIMYAAVTAKALGLPIIALTGETGGEIKNIADVTIKVPERETYMIQELHLPVYHCLCLMLEERFFW